MMGMGLGSGVLSRWGTLVSEDLTAWRSWDAKSQEALAEKLADTIGSEPARYWFCTRGRSCDGGPHEGFDYPHARGEQWPPAGRWWTTWFLSGGRGAGKTATGAQYTRKVNEQTQYSIIVGPTVTHLRDVMVEGPSGLLAAFDQAKVRVQWEPSKRRITNLANGNVIFAFTGEEPERLRGPNSGFVWLDEPAHMARIQDVWDNAMLGLRIGRRPHALCTTTPLPTAWVKALAAADDTAYKVMPTYANLKNLAPTFRKAVLSKYEGTRLGRQELNGEIIEDVEGALWSAELIDENRSDLTAQDMDHITVGVDPNGTSSKKRDEAGIVAVGRLDNHLYVLADVSGHYSPDQWSKEAWRLFDKLQADDIVAEKNYGGEMVLATLRNAREDMSAHLGMMENPTLVTSRRGKQLRAEPIVGLYEQGRMHHCSMLTELEDQMNTWVPDLSPSPDRVDALVHAATNEASRTRGTMSISVPRGSFDTSLVSTSYSSVWSR